MKAAEIDAIRNLKRGISFSEAEEEAGSRGLMINADKTECMLSSRNQIGPNFHHYRLQLRSVIGLFLSRF